MHIILLVVLAALIFLPQWWVKQTLQRYNQDLDRIPGTGSELARHLLDRFGLEHVLVEATNDGGDHYDPVSQKVRLSESYMSARSLTAVAVATHEVGHAIQHANGHSLLALRSRLVGISQLIQKLASGALLLAPVLMLLTRTPAVGLALVGLSVVSFFSVVLIHLVTLPVELDASFGKALPILREGYIEPVDVKPVEQILKAAALTYVAASAASLLNVWRWLKLARH